MVSAWRVLKSACFGFLDDDVLSLSAALSFYTLLSFAPLIVLGVWASSSLGFDQQETMLGQIGSVAGPEARNTAKAVVDSANQHASVRSFAGIFGIVMSLVGATTVFAQLQVSLNRILSIESRPGNAIWAWLRRRVLSIGLIGAIVFVLIVSLLVSSALGVVLSQRGPIWDVFNQLISAGVFATLFLLLFRYMPDARLPWRQAAWGGLVTALLFALGKWVIAFYLSRGDVGGAYGAAGSLVVLLVWVYYSSAIFFFGAEVVRAWFREHGERVEPAEHAVQTDTDD